MATLLLWGHSANQNAETTKILLPSGEEGCSPNENTGFPDTTNTTCNRSNKNARFLDTTKLHAEEGYSANENAGFPYTTKTTCYRSATQCWGSITCYSLLIGFQLLVLKGEIQDALFKSYMSGQSKYWDLSQFPIQKSKQRNEWKWVRATRKEAFFF